MVGLETGGYVRCGLRAAGFEEVKHGAAGVYGFGAEVGVGGEELGEETAVTVAEDEGLLLVLQSGEVVGSAALEGWAEGQVFEPAVRACNQVEVGLDGGGVHWRRPRKSSGVRRARSAAARRVVREMCCGSGGGPSRQMAERAQAVARGSGAW